MTRTLLMRTVRPRLRLRGDACALLGLALGLSAPVGSATLTDLRDLRRASDGARPSYTGMLAQGRDGNLYGTIPSGGANGAGTAFKVSPTGQFTKLHDFVAATDGAAPYSGLTLGANGAFYGTTHHGGALGRGTVFQMSPTGDIVVLHDFDPAAGEGYDAYAPPVQAADGKLYGTTTRGGTSDAGTVYKVWPSRRRFSTLFSFHRDAASDTYPLGAYPYAPLTLGKYGVLYGTASAGGAYNRGTLFRFTIAGAPTPTTSYDFDYVHGAAPYSRVQLDNDGDGNLYGVTSSGGEFGDGTIFRFLRVGIMEVLHNFNANTAAGRTEGYAPYAGLVQPRFFKFYGVTTAGGSGCGVAFSLTEAGVYKVEATFDSAHGCSPYSTPFQHTNGKIYGLTRGGGIGNGALYSLDGGEPEFVTAVPGTAPVGTKISLLGNMSGTTEVAFASITTDFSGTSATFRRVTVPAGRASGRVTVATTTGTRISDTFFNQLPTVSGFSPTSGAAGTSVVVNGTGLSQAKIVRFGGDYTASFTVDNDGQITATVPRRAVTGSITVITSGGKGSSSNLFTVPAK